MTDKNLNEYRDSTGELIPQEQVEEWLKFKKQVEDHNQYSKQVLKKLEDSLSRRGFKHDILQNREN